MRSLQSDALVKGFGQKNMDGNAHVNLFMKFDYKEVVADKEPRTRMIFGEMNKIAAILFLALSSGGFAAEPEIVPRTAYRLTFEVDAAPAGTRWAVHLRDGGGNLPFDGALESEWQQLTPDRKNYSLLFYAPSDAATFELLIRDPSITASAIRLEKFKFENLLLNGDFSEDNYSGWSERYNAQLANEEGKPILRVNQNGYALTDYVPVFGGGSYVMKSLQGAPGFQVLAYDSLRYFIGVVERKPGAVPFEIPKDAAFLRVIYATGHLHLPTWRVNEIVKAELLAEKIPAQTPPVKVEKSDAWEIVLATGSDPREEHAARELQHWMTAITGKVPALLAEPSRDKLRKIFLGRASADSFLDDLKFLQGSDGFAVRTKEENIYVFGEHPRATLYGVHALLERNTDIIWPRPNPEFVAIFSQTPSLTLADADFLSRPVFKDRYISGNQSVEFFDWQGSNGLNTPWALHKGNNYLAWLRGAELGYSGSYMFWLGDVREKDEKVLPLIDGKRVNNVWRQPCYTYQGTVDAIVATFRNLLETLPGRKMEYFHPTIADNWTVCGCDDCMAPIILPNGETLTAESSNAAKESLFFSTRNFLMLNKVAESLKKDYPDLRLRSHAYIFTAEPPKIPVDSAIIPEFAAYPTQNLRYPILSGAGKKIAGYEKDTWKRRFEQWGKDKKGELGYFGYYYPDGFTAVADTAAEDMRALAHFGGGQVHTEEFPEDGEELSAWDADGIEKWVMTKLMWDPSQDPEALRKEYIRRVYHGAEKEMTAFYQLIRDAWHEAPESVFITCHTPASELFQALIITPGIEEQAKQWLVKAENVADKPQAQKIIQRHRAYFEKLGDTLGRTPVPYVPESTNDWLEMSSPHWEKAVVVEGFQKVDDWRVFDKAESAYPTKVRSMHDGEYIYLRFDGSDDHLADQVKPSAPAGPVFPKGDRFEAILRNAKNKDVYLAVGPGEHYFSKPPLGNRWRTSVSKGEKSWTATMAIPLDALGETEEERAAVNIRLGRVYRGGGEDGEESSHNGSGIFNDHPSFWLNFQIKGL